MSQTPGSSSSQAGNASSHLEDLKARKADYEHAIGEMEKHLSVASDGTIVLDVKNAADIHVNPDAFDELGKSLQKVNTLLRINQLQPTQVGLKTDFGPSVVMEARITAAGSCPGIDHTYTYWWGHQIDLNECQTQKLIADLQIGAGVAALVALLTAALVPIAIIAGVIGAIMAIEQGVFQYYDQQCGHQGIAIYMTYFSDIPWAGCQ